MLHVATTDYNTYSPFLRGKYKKRQTWPNPQPIAKMKAIVLVIVSLALWANAYPQGQTTPLLEGELYFIMCINSEWPSTKLVEYESLRGSNGQVGSSKLKNGWVRVDYASIQY